MVRRSCSPARTVTSATTEQGTRAMAARRDRNRGQSERQNWLGRI